jgi:hypothetical protein
VVNAPREPSAEDLLHLDIDVRIGADLWALGIEEYDDEVLGAVLRFAYGRGYYDALSEPQRGQLCRDHGFAVPKRRADTGV